MVSWLLLLGVWAALSGQLLGEGAFLVADVADDADFGTSTVKGHVFYMFMLSSRPIRVIRVIRDKISPS
jgi:hypothetical protein